MSDDNLQSEGELRPQKQTGAEPVSRDIDVDFNDQPESLNEAPPSDINVDPSGDHYDSSSDRYDMHKDNSTSGNSGQCGDFKKVPLSLRRLEPFNNPGLKEDSQPVTSRLRKR